MDIKETILETLQEIEENDSYEEALEKTSSKEACDEEFLKHLRERILVLFDGLQSPNTQNIEVKLDVTLNFLEYLLARIDEKLKK
jgi:hypothetical protein